VFAGQDLEDSIFNSFDKKFSFYYRYVDGIILTALTNDIERIVKTFNSYHNRLQLTVEHENNRCLNFLDLTIKISTILFTQIGIKKIHFQEGYYHIFPIIPNAI